METKAIIDLAIGQAGCSEILITTNGVVLLVKYGYLVNGESRSSALRFDDVSAFQFVDEKHGRHVPGCYNSVVEIIDSAWLQALLAKETKGILGSVKGMHHFVVLFSSNGYLEVIASEVCELCPDDLSEAF